MCVVVVGGWWVEWVGRWGGDRVIEKHVTYTEQTINTTPHTTTPRNTPGSGLTRNDVLYMNVYVYVYKLRTDKRRKNLRGREVIKRRPCRPRDRPCESSLRTVGRAVKTNQPYIISVPVCIKLRTDKRRIHLRGREIMKRRPCRARQRPCESYHCTPGRSVKRNTFYYICMCMYICYAPINGD